MGVNIKQVILVAVSLIVIATVLPLAIGLISVAGDTLISNVSGVEKYLSDVADPAVITLLTVLLPILAIIGITMYFLPRFSD